jgi:hypothetical protein
MGFLGFDNHYSRLYKVAMTPTYEILYAADALTAQIRRSIVRETPVFQEIAECLCGARALRVRASEIALSLPQGRDRDFVLTIRKRAWGCEKKLRQKLGSALPAPAPGSSGY